MRKIDLSNLSEYQAIIEMILIMHFVHAWVSVYVCLVRVTQVQQMKKKKQSNLNDNAFYVQTFDPKCKSFTFFSVVFVRSSTENLFALQMHPIRLTNM